MASFIQSIFLQKKENENNIDSYSAQTSIKRKEGLIPVTDSVIYRDTILSNIEKYGITENKMKKLVSKQEKFKEPLNHITISKKDLGIKHNQLDKDDSEYKNITKYLNQIKSIEYLVDSINSNFDNDKIEKISLDNKNLNSPEIKVKFKDIEVYKKFNDKNITQNINSIKKHQLKIDYNNGKMGFIKDKRDNKQLDLNVDNLSTMFVSGYKDAERDFNNQIKEYHQKHLTPLRHDINALSDEVEFTKDIKESIWLTPDNNMIWGEYELGTRGTDHRDLLDIYNLDRDDKDSWAKIHKLGYVRLVSETDTALIYDNQPFSKEQKETIEKGGFSIESYGTLDKIINHDKQKKDNSMER